MKKSLFPTDLPTPDLHQLMVGAISPRPIAFVSTVDAAGNDNLAPYSFFNVFSSNPPIMVFSSNRKVGDNTTKDTLHNVQATRQAVINVVNYDTVRQMAVTSAGFAPGVSEFEKAGLTPVAADLVQPKLVAESPVSFECEVDDIITLGEHGGAGHLIICKVVKIHAAAHIFDEKGRIDPHRLDTVGRLGRAFYTRASEGVFRIFQPMNGPSIGFEALPAAARHSTVLTGNDLGAMAGLMAPPSDEVRQAVAAAADFKAVQADTAALHALCQRWIAAGQAAEALAALQLAEEG